MRSFLSVVVVPALAVACSGAEPEPPAEAPPPRGVYGTAPAPVGGTPSVITLTALPAGEGARGTTGADEGDDAPTIDQLGLVFTPTTLVARLGERVVFTNSETLVHNVRLTSTDSDSTILDVETDPGTRVEFVFDRPGGYDVTCDHHPGMRAFVYVTEADHTVFADNTGAFALPDVAPGPYTLAVWSVNPQLRRSQEINVGGPSTEVVLQGP